MGKIVVVTGGSKSGKSRYAEHLAKQSGHAQITYVATEANQNHDQETKLRISKHRQQRPSSWQTIEQFEGIAQLIKDQTEQCGFLIDCVTLLVTNLFFTKLPHYLQEVKNDTTGNLEQSVEQFTSQDITNLQAYLIEEMYMIIHAIKQSEVDVWLITNEVGMGIVPEHPLGRILRDYYGEVNQLIANEADDVYFCISGIPTKIK